MNFQYKSIKDQLSLDVSNVLSVNSNTNTDPRDSLKQHTIKPTKDFSAFKKPGTVLTNRSVNIFQTGIIENVSGPVNNCSSCGGAK
jgi:hypothetical protein